jgi:hypothetical protein
VIKKDYIRAAKTVITNDKNIKNNIIKNDEVISENIINQDVWYNILMNLKFEDLKNACLTDKNASKVCHIVSFWKDKFNHDGLLMLSEPPQNVEEWIKFYEKNNNAHNMTEKIIKIMTNDNRNDISTYIDLNENMNKIIPQFEKDIQKAPDKFVGDYEFQQGISVEIKNNIIKFKFFYLTNYGDELSYFKYNITYEQLFDMIYRMVYYNAKITDSAGVLYSEEALKNRLNNIHKDVWYNLYMERLRILQL